MAVLAEPSPFTQEGARLVEPGPDLPSDPDSSGWARPRVTSAQARNDAVLAVGLFVLAVVVWILQESLYYPASSRMPGWAVVLVIAGYTLPLAARRRWPGLVLAVVTAAQIFSEDRQVIEATVVLVALFVAFYTVGAWSPDRRHARVVRVLAAVAQAVSTPWIFLSTNDQMYGNHPDRGTGLVSSLVADVLLLFFMNAIFVVAGWMYGNHAWASAQERARVVWRTHQLAREQLRGERQAVALERLRIARGLHDTVARHVAAMGRRAAAARALLTSGRAAQGAESLGVVESAAKRVVAGLGQVLGALRNLKVDGSDVAGLGVERLPVLVSEARDTGMTVSYDEVGEPRSLPVLVSLDLYRIAQEALTNACKHASPTVKVAVALRYLDDAAEIEIADDGGGRRPAVSVPSTGLGLVGMRERVAAAGGTLQVGLSPQGGLAVRASLPLVPPGPRPAARPVEAGPSCDPLVDPDSPRWVRPRVTPAQLRNDAILAVGLFALAIVESTLRESSWDVTSRLPGWAVGLVIAGHTLPLAARRRLPGCVFVVVGAMQLAAINWEVWDLYVGDATLFVALCSVGAWSPVRVRATVVRAVTVAICLGWLAWYQLSQMDQTLEELPDASGGRLVDVRVAFVLMVVLGNTALTVIPWMYGNHAWAAARDRARVVWRTRQLAREQLRGERQAVALERLRIARELHDTVAHHVAVIGVQAAAARALTTSGRTAQGVESSRAVETAAHRAAVELDQVLGALRDLEIDGSDVAGLGVERLPALVAEARDAGMTVTYGAVGAPGPLPVLTSLNLYRIAQEGLTNARKHAGPLAEVAVRLRYLGNVVEIEVCDDGGGGRPLTSVPSTGLGLVGMRERVAAAGGRLHVAPRSRGGFVVRASLPVGA